MNRTKRKIMGIVGLLALCLTACGTTIAEPEPEPAATAVLPTSIPTAVPLATELPPTATLPPTSTPISQPTNIPDQSGNVWVIQAQGVQCEGNTFADLDAAVKSLRGQGVTVLAAEEVALNVLAVCGGATSIHYRIQIATPDLPTAEQSGWALDN